MEKVQMCFSDVSNVPLPRHLMLQVDCIMHAPVYNVIRCIALFPYLTLLWNAFILNNQSVSSYLSESNSDLMIWMFSSNSVRKTPTKFKGMLELLHLSSKYFKRLNTRLKSDFYVSLPSFVFRATLLKSIYLYTILQIFSNFLRVCTTYMPCSL
jgi:hypothetical protein